MYLHLVKPSGAKQVNKKHTTTASIFFAPRDMSRSKTHPAPIGLVVSGEGAQEALRRIANFQLSFDRRVRKQFRNTDVICDVPQQIPGVGFGIRIGIPVVVRRELRSAADTIRDVVEKSLGISTVVKQVSKRADIFAQLMPA